MNRTIKVSLEVAAAVQASKKSADQILREVLIKDNDALVTKEGVIFPNGTAFQAWYKDRSYYAKVSNGTIEIMGKHVETVSAAAKVIVNRPINGWDFWDCKRPGENKFVPVSQLRLVKSSVSK